MQFSIAPPLRVVLKKKTDQWVKHGLTLIYEEFSETVPGLLGNIVLFNTEKRYFKIRTCLGFSSAEISSVVLDDQTPPIKEKEVKIRRREVDSQLYEASADRPG